jgi:chromosome partitioning protein
MADGRTNLTEEVIREVRQQMGNLAYDTVIPRNVKLGEAPSHGKTILEYAPDSKGGEAYEALCNEFLQRHGALVHA